jgi:membrane-associated phospholipid phosphatase
MRWPILRTSEWVLVVFFGYNAAISPFFRDRPHLGYQPVILFAGVFGFLWALASKERAPAATAISIVRDWLPIPLTLVSFRGMEVFVPSSYPRTYEAIWVRWDDLLLNGWHVRRGIESLGAVIPLYLEICYFLVYGVAAFCLVVLYANRRREKVNLFLTIYLLGTLLAYALFPYFPSQPPRIAFPAIASPVVTWARELNLLLLRNASIHSGVFPSAHVSAAFSCAWGMFLVLPQRKRIGWGLLVYAISVSIATIYGRYHYAADVAAGFGVSLVSGAVCLVLAKREPHS